MATKRLYRSKLKNIKVLLLDVDGVLTDGGVYYTDAGVEEKKFHVQDGQGITKLQHLGITVGIITGRHSKIVQRRAAELGVREVYQNRADKLDAYGDVKRRLKVEDAEVAYIGDDDPDLPVLQRVGFSAAPADAVDAVRRAVDYVCRKNGGGGAVREVIELLLAARQMK
ncbi:MAG TPA: hypothetical protein DCP63_03370 [Bacteroidetes bacterium]|nr:hypothetical protein [Bacteroidota bacterium]